MNHLLDFAGALLYTIFITIVAPLLFVLYSFLALVDLLNYIHPHMRKLVFKIKTRKRPQPVFKYRLNVRELLHV